MGIVFRACLTAVSLAITATSASAAFAFQDLGGLGSDTYTIPRALSGDGQTIVGFSRASTFSGNNAAWKWSSGTMSAIAGLSEATGVSFDGSVICGTNGSIGWRFAPSGNTQVPRTPYDVSPDGNIVLGVISSTDQGYRWTSSGTTFIPGLTNSYSPASGMNSDGSIIVGQSRSASGNYVAYRWTAATGTVALTTGVGAASNSAGNAVSDDGSIIVGFTLQQGSGVAAFWTAASGWRPMVSNGDFGSAQGLTPDGSIAVGSSANRAFIWDPEHGLRNLQNLLTTNGINLTGWNLIGAVDISDDGQTILGYGTDSTGATKPWIATIPEPGALMVLVAACMGLRRRKMLHTNLAIGGR